MSQRSEIRLDLLRHQSAPFSQEGWIVVDGHALHAFGNAVHVEVLAQIFGIGDVAVALTTAIALLQQLDEVRLRLFVADCDVDLALRHDVVRDLVVLATGQQLNQQTKRQISNRKLWRPL